MNKNMNKDILVSVVAPVYNEKDCIEKYIHDTIEVLKENYLNYELVLVDDGSVDKSASMIKDIQNNVENIRLLSLSRNYGREIAITAGLESSIGDYVILMDSDLQDSPSLIPTLVKKAMEGYDVVYAARTSREGEGFFKKISSRYFYRIASSMTGFNIPEDAGDFRVFSRKVVNSINQLKESNRYMKMLYAYVGFSVAKVPFTRQKRFAGETKYNYSQLINASLDAIISFSNKPLRIVSILSIALSLVLLIVSIGIIVYKLASPNSIVDGWASAVVIITFLFSVLFIFLSVISEYIGRTLSETKNRPLYYIKDESNSSVLQDKNIMDDL
jgi:polyisoprenyl-phosphate glycosyltransferase